jgi:hypothetical protein
MIEFGSDDTYAQCGNVLMERGATEPVEDFRARARATARECESDVLIWGRLQPVVWVDDVQIIEIRGGMTDDATGDFATVGDTLVERADGELIEAFRVRAREAACSSGARSRHFRWPAPMPMNYEDEGETA